MGETAKKQSKWDDPTSRAHWNRRLAAEGLATIKGKQVLKRDRRTGKMTVVRTGQEARRKSR